MKAMNQIRWAQRLGNCRVYQASGDFLSERARPDFQPAVLRRGDDVREAALPALTRALIEKLFEHAPIESIEVDQFSITVKVNEMSFGRYDSHKFCISTIHQILWGQDADVLVVQTTFLG